MATLFSGQCLQPGQKLQSNNKRFTLTMQTDGNVVLYDANGHPLWATNTWKGITPRDFAMQPDGNLVLYSTDGVARWASNTVSNPGAFLNIQDDGNLVVYRAGSRTETADNALWAAGSNAPQPVPPRPDGFIEEILAAHNKYRAEVGAPPLQWSDDLATTAKQWADHLASAGRGLEHSGPGQNLWSGGTGFFSFTRMVDDWGAEKRFYKPGLVPDVSTSGNFGDVGHYTQLIWRSTTHVGGGVSSGGGNDYLVCNYSPAGNVLGQGVG
ncbi:MAG TPA: CAP domain-containing protein [Kofleriaceae bacterium]